MSRNKKTKFYLLATLLSMPILQAAEGDPNDPTSLTIKAINLSSDDQKEKVVANLALQLSLTMGGQNQKQAECEILAEWDKRSERRSNLMHLMLITNPGLVLGHVKFHLLGSPEDDVQGMQICRGLLYRLWNEKNDTAKQTEAFALAVIRGAARNISSFDEHFFPSFKNRVNYLFETLKVWKTKDPEQHQAFISFLNLNQKNTVTQETLEATLRDRMFSNSDDQLLLPQSVRYVDDFLGWWINEKDTTLFHPLNHYKKLATTYLESQHPIQVVEILRGIIENYWRKSHTGNDFLDLLPPIYHAARNLYFRCESDDPKMNSLYKKLERNATCESGWKMTHREIQERRLELQELHPIAFGNLDLRNHLIALNTVLSNLFKAGKGKNIWE